MGTRLYVGNLAYGATDSDLWDLFSAAGGVVSAEVVRDRDTGRSRGFAFVEMETAEEAEKAISMFDGMSFQNRDLRVNEARPRERRGGGRRDSSFRSR
ncbi:MAG: RNA-binding protein [Anaerolineae bacterium]|nr:RNA-binding protein [Anaerolineae bacterium]